MSRYTETLTYQDGCFIHIRTLSGPNNQIQTTGETTSWTQHSGSKRLEVIDYFNFLITKAMFFTRQTEEKILNNLYNEKPVKWHPSPLSPEDLYYRAILQSRLKHQ